MAPKEYLQGRSNYLSIALQHKRVLCGLVMGHILRNVFCWSLLPKLVFVLSHATLYREIYFLG